MSRWREHCCGVRLEGRLAVDHVGTSSILIYIKSNRKPVNIKTMK